MELGTAIICSSAIFATVFGIVTIVFRLKKNNPGNPGNSVVNKRLDAMNKKFGEMRKEETCDEIVKRIEGTFGTLEKTMEIGFGNINTQLIEIRKGLK